MVENELTYETIKKMPDSNDHESRQSKNNLHIEEVETMSLEEINTKVDAKTNERNAAKNIFIEQLRISESPWLETIYLMNEKIYGNRELLGIEDLVEEEKRIKRKERAIKRDYAGGTIFGWYKDIEKQVDRLIDEGKVEESKKSALVGVLGGYAYDIVNPELGKEANTELKQPMLDGDVKKWKESTPRKLFRNILAENQDYKPVGKIRNPVRIFVEKRYLSALKETNVTIGNEEIEIETLQGTEADEVYEVNTTQSGSKKIRPAKIINRIYDKIKSPFQIEYDKSRADFLKLGGAVVGAAFLAPVVKVFSDPEVRAGIGAAATRPDVLIDGVKNEASPEILINTWREHFKGKEHLLPIEVWSRLTESTGGVIKIEGSGVHINILADHCYEKDKRSGEKFDEYYMRFVDNLHRYSDMAGLDFITLVASLQISAENLGGFVEPKKESNIDVAVSRIQEVGVTSARSIGMENYAVSTIGPGGDIVQIMDKLAEAGYEIPESLENVLPRGGIRFYDLIRFKEQPTVGLMDMEPGERATAYGMFPDNPLVNLIKETYPEVAKKYEEVNEIREQVNIQREELRNISETYIEKYSKRLEPFAEADYRVLNDIGVSEDMSRWQVLNYTDTWYKDAELPTNPEYTYQRTAEYMKSEAKKNRVVFYKRLLSQQIRNPNFFNYLKSEAEKDGDMQELDLLSDMDRGINNLEEQSKELRIAHLLALKAEGKYEYDSGFQQINSVLVTKRLSEIAGAYNPEDRNSLGWHIYKTCANREIAPIPFLVDDKVFARDITIDPPYAQEEMTKSLDTFAVMLTSAGVLKNSPDADIATTYNTIEKMFWRDGGVWPNTEKGEWDQILEHFNIKMANRLFYDFAGLFRDEEKMLELNQVMIDNKIVSDSADEDPYNFYTQLVYLMLDSWHMRRDISPEDWDKAEEYVKQHIMPLATTNLRYASGVVAKKWNIGSADYPPIFRCQAVMYNFLIDQNPASPSSASSSDILGHH